MAEPKFKHIETYNKGEPNENSVWEVTMPDGNKFRYSWGHMVPFATNRSEPAPTFVYDDGSYQMVG